MSRARSVPRPVRDKPPSGERHPFVSHELTVMHESAHVRGRCRPWSVPVKRFAAPTSRGAKFWWNDLLGGAVPHDSVNLLGGITHLPLAYPSGKVRLAVNQYLVYERRGLDYISPKRVDDLFASTEIADRVFRLGEPQRMLEVNGMIVPGHPLTEVGKRQMLWMEYHVGGTNASNVSSDGNVSKGVYDGTWCAGTTSRSGRSASGRRTSRTTRWSPRRPSPAPSCTGCHTAKTRPLEGIRLTREK